LNRFYQENRAKSWQVVGVAIDQPSAVVKFLGKLPLSFPVAMGGLEGTEVSRVLGNKTGSLPFTVVLDAAGRVVHRKMGTLVAEELETLLASYTPH
jgi:peroxiredoxin